MKYVEPEVGLERFGFLAEPELEAECKDCIYFNRSLTNNPCHDCYPTTERKDFERGEARDNELEEVGCEDCSCCGTDMS